MMASIVTATGWTYRQILWEHTEDQVIQLIAGNNILAEDFKRESKSGGKSIKATSPEIARKFFKGR